MIYALNNNKTRVPYRESKLTRILQDSLGGISRALMVACLVWTMDLVLAMILFFSFLFFHFMLVDLAIFKFIEVFKGKLFSLIIESRRVPGICSYCELGCSVKARIQFCSFIT